MSFPIIDARRQVLHGLLVLGPPLGLVDLVGNTFSSGRARLQFIEVGVLGRG